MDTNFQDILGTGLGDAMNELNSLVGDTKIYATNPTVATEVEYENLLKNQLVTANNVKNMMKDYVLPKIYFAFSLTIVLIFLMAIILKTTLRANSERSIIEHHSLGGAITKTRY